MEVTVEKSKTTCGALKNNSDLNTNYYKIVSAFKTCEMSKENTANRLINL